MATARLSPAFIWAQETPRKFAPQSWETYLQVDTDFGLHLRADEEQVVMISPCCRSWLVAKDGDHFYYCDACERKVISHDFSIYKDWRPGNGESFPSIFFHQAKLGAYNVKSACLSLDLVLEDLPNGEEFLDFVLNAKARLFERSYKQKSLKEAHAYRLQQMKAWQNYASVTLF